jgi:outer membrane lipoprotein-sorting protein
MTLLLRQRPFVLALFWLAGTGLAARVQAEPLADVLARLDASAQQFRSFSAHVKRTDFTAVLNESEVMNGAFRFRRGKGGVSGVMDFTGPDAHTIGISAHNVQRYSPKAGVVEIYDTTKYTAVMDEYLLLGFGTTAAELHKVYDIKLGGVETLGAVSATRLELTPRSAEVAKLVRKIDLWVAEGQGNPAQVKITEPSKDTVLVEYSDLVVNPALPDSAFELKLPAGVKKLNPKK